VKERLTGLPIRSCLYPLRKLQSLYRALAGD